MSAGGPVAVLLWIAFAILIAAALWVLLAACGLAWPGGRPMLVFCPLGIAARADPALAAEQERQRALQRSVRDLEIALLERPYCAPSEPETEPEPPSIEDAIRQQDVQALEGCWELDSDLTMEVIETGEPIRVRRWEVCFSDDGSGDQILVLTEGSQCEARVRASFPDQSTFVMHDVANLRCRGGRLEYGLAATTTCKLAGNASAQCVRSDQDRPENSSNVTLRRKG